MGASRYAGVGELPAAAPGVRELPAAAVDSARGAGRAARAPSLTVMAALAAIFNVLALNLVLLLACLPLVTIPVAFQAAVIALDRWRRDGEERVVVEFVAALRSRPLVQTTVRAGLPLVTAAVALEEVHYFSRGGGPIGWLCLGLAVAGVLLSLAGWGYVLVLGARRPNLATSELWTLSLSLVVRNVFSASALLVAEFVGVGLVLLADPLLALIGLPLALVALIWLTAGRGIRSVARRGRG